MDKKNGSNSQPPLDSNKDERPALGPAIRGRQQRAQLPGHDCVDCQRFWNSTTWNGSIKDKINKCSKHRYVYGRPRTPDHFWDADFPDEEECRRRGLIDY